MIRKHKRVAAVASLALCLAPGAVLASSHREAPLITQSPKLDGTDFYMFNSYEPGRSNFVTMIANYIPLQDAYGGPNFFTLDNNAVYDIHIDNRGTATPAMTFRFRFTTTEKNLTLNIGGQNVPVALVGLGPVSTSNTATQNVIETYTLSLVTSQGGREIETPIADAATGGNIFTKPVDNIGMKTIPNYPAYANTFIYNIRIPGCATPGRVFVGQRAEGFVVNLAETFDLINYKNPVGEQFANTTKNDLADKNVTSLTIEAPTACLRTAADPVIAGWTTSSSVVRRDNDRSEGRRGDDDRPLLKQASRLANPLVNEVVIGLKDKDKFNASQPINDPQFLTYVTNPTLPAIIELLFGTKAPTAFPRTDLVAVFLTGIAGVNQPVSLKAPGEEMRLNTSIAPKAKGAQNRLGVIGGDAAGYPNGRRPGDDVVDISLRVVMGKLYTGSTALFGTPSQAPSGELEFTDGAFVDSTFFLNAFPYLQPPHSGSPQP